MIAAQLPSSIVSIKSRDILDYVMTVNADNVEQIVRIATLCEHDGDDSRPCRFIIERCVEIYGSIANTPLQIIRKIDRMIDINSEVFEYQRPFIDYLTTMCEVKSDSVMFPILFPHLCQSLEISKEEFLSNAILGEDLEKLYELHMSEIITSEDIMEFGLHYVHSCCEWMVSKSSRVKSAQQLNF